MHRYKTITEMDEQWRTIAILLEESEGEVTEHIENLMKGLEMKAEQIADHMENIIRELSAKKSRYEEERKRLADKEKSAENAVNRAKQTLQFIVERFGKENKKGNKEILTDSHTYWVQASESVVIEDVNKIPSEYHNVSVVLKFANLDDWRKNIPKIKEINGTNPGASSDVKLQMIKNAINSGQAVPGARIEKNWSIRIK